MEVSYYTTTTQELDQSFEFRVGVCDLGPHSEFIIADVVLFG